MTIHVQAQTRAYRYRRRGSSYVLFLGTAMMVTVIGLSSLMVVRIQRRSDDGTNDVATARFYAQSAIEMGFAHINEDPNWRTTYANGVWEADQPIGTGTYTLEVTDPNDGDLSNNEADSVVLTGIGMQGDACYKLQVTLQAEGGALSCLDVAFCTGGNLSLDDASALCDQIISSNDSVTGVASSQIDGDVEAVGTITGIFGSGTRTPGITARAMPDANTVYDYYKDIANGTPIDINTIPNSMGTYTISGVVLSPMSNPFGAGVTNPKGIYVIDAQGYELEIEYSRIVGTLVILNGSPVCSYVQGAVNWEPAVSNYPALLVQGPLCLHMDGTVPLDETDAGTSLNPQGTPYGDPGNWDDDTGDTYPSIIKGLVYAESRLDVASFPVVNGVVVSGGIANLTPSAVFDLTFDTTYLDNPPPGFRNLRISVSDGSWRRGIN